MWVVDWTDEKNKKIPKVKNKKTPACPIVWTFGKGWSMKTVVGFATTVCHSPHAIYPCLITLVACTFYVWVMRSLDRLISDLQILATCWWQQPFLASPPSLLWWMPRTLCVRTLTMALHPFRNSKNFRNRDKHTRLTVHSCGVNTGLFPSP